MQDRTSDDPQNDFDLVSWEQQFLAMVPRRLDSRWWGADNEFDGRYDPDDNSAIRMAEGWLRFFGE